MHPKAWEPLSMGIWVRGKGILGGKNFLSEVPKTGENREQKSRVSNAGKELGFFSSTGEPWQV